jgi:hypothetical protein
MGGKSANRFTAKRLYGQKRSPECERCTQECVRHGFVEKAGIQLPFLGLSVFSAFFRPSMQCATGLPGPVASRRARRRVAVTMSSSPVQKNGPAHAEMGPGQWEEN